MALVMQPYPWAVGELLCQALVGLLVLIAPSGLVDVTQRSRWEMSASRWASGSR